MKDEAIEFRKLVCNTINSNELPFSVKYFILKDIMDELKGVYTKYVDSLEIQQQYQQEETEKEEEQ